MLRQLEKLGHHKPPALTPAEFASSLPPGTASDAVLEFTTTYYDLRFGASRPAADRLTHLLDRIERLC
jgi:hypothetical protein